MQILQSQTARTQLQMSSVARIQQGLGSEQLRVNNKNEHLPHTWLPYRSKCHVHRTLQTKDGVQPKSEAYAKNPEVTRSKQMMVLYKEKHKTI